MNQNELELIKKIVDKDIENRDLKDLMKVKSYIDKRIYAQSLEDKKAKELEMRANPAYWTYLETRDILEKNLMDFIKGNLTGRDLSARIYRQIAMRAASILDLDYRTLRVCDIIGIDKEKLLDERNIGEKSINLVENLLNQYGLSLDTELSNEEKQLLGIPIERVMRSRIERLHRYNN